MLRSTAIRPKVMEKPFCHSKLSSSIQVGKFFIPTDFVVIEMEEDMQTPLLLGRPFLATAGALIDVKNGKLTLEVGEEKVVFNIAKSLKYPSNEDSVCRIETIDTLVVENLTDIIIDDPMMRTLTQTEGSLSLE